MNETPHNQNDEFAPPPRDELDGLLREWHATNAAKASAGRDRLMAALTQEDAAQNRDVLARIEPKVETREQQRPLAVIRRIIVNRYAPLAAAAIVLAVLVPFVFTGKSGFVKESNAQTNVVMAPEGGRLDAFDKDGNALGPCALKHTDVKADISGRFTRVTVVQQYHNPNPDKIEAVYTFPLSDRSGVDRMTMTIGDRVIVGEVKERQQARRIYEQAKQSNRVASLLEQERPNIFTQSIANIEPGATIEISISYVEMVAEHDGEFSFAFPTVVSPRYIPGAADYKRELSRLPNPIPPGVHARRGVVLMGPASVTAINRGPGISRSDKGLDDRLLNGAIASAIPVSAPDNAAEENAYFVIQAAYADGSRESGLYRRDGFGEIGGRWFYCPPPVPTHTPNAPNEQVAPGDNFAQSTNQVPDADRITPMPTRPDVRAGHDISISVMMDTGGPGITFLDSPQHKVSRTDLARNANDQPRRVSLALEKLSTIPNRDFVLKWKQTADSISSRVFTHTGDTGNFFTVQLDPPAQVEEVRAVPRELVFVVDTSGSMNGKPMAMCKEVMRKAIDQMRPRDTFNIITFAGATRILWERPRANTTANREEAQRFIDSQEGRGGTEMMKAIEAALHQGPMEGIGHALTATQLADLPADGRQVVVEADDSVFRSEGLTKDAVTDRAELHIRDDLSIKCSPFQLPTPYLKRANETVADDSITLKLLMRGTWTTVNGERIFQVTSAEMSHDSSVRPLRIVMFLTDAEVGNDFAIIDAIKRNRDTARVFSFGIGSSVNRFLIEQMALVGGGEPEFVYANQTTDQQAAEAVERFNRRTKTPILTDIRVTFNGVQPLDVLPEVASVQDLWDNRPLTFMGRYAAAGIGSLTIKGQTAQGAWERTIPIEFPAKQPGNSSLPTLWARTKIDALIGTDLLGAQRGTPNPDVRAKVITLGETFNVMSQYTSFVAVDKLRVTVDGKPRLVHVPIELPDQTNWEGFFGEMAPAGDDVVRQRAEGTVDAAGKPVQLQVKAETLEKLVAQSDMLRKRAEAERVEERDTRGLGNMAFEPASVAPAAKPAAPPVSGQAIPSQPGGGGPRGSSDGKLDALRTDEKKKAMASPAAPAAVVSPPAPAATPAPAPATGAFSAGEASKTPKLEALADNKVKDQGRRMPADPASSGVEYRIVDRNETSATGQSVNAPAGDSTLNFSVQSRVVNKGNTITRDSRVLRSVTDLDSSTSLTPIGKVAQSKGLSSFGRTSGAAGEDKLDDLSSSVLAYRDRLGSHYYSGFTLSLSDANDRDSESTRASSNSVAGSVLTIAAAQLAEAGRLDEAKLLICPATVAVEQEKKADGTGTPIPTGGVAATVSPPEQLCSALNATLPDADRLAAIHAARQAAASDLLARRRASMIQRKLAPDVVIQITPPPQPYGADAVPAEPGVTRKETATTVDPKKTQYLTLTILLSDTSAKTLDAMKAMGITILSVKQEASVVVARVPLQKVEELALMDAVRRVELVPAEDAEKKVE